MYTEVYERIATLEVEPVAPSYALIGEAGKIEVYKGTRAFSGIAIEAEGSGAWAEGHVKGSIKTYDYTALYQLYNMKNTESADYWFVHYSKETSHDQLVKTFEHSEEKVFDYDLKYRIQGNDYGITSVRLGFTTIRIDYEGMTKMFSVPNGASTKAKLDGGEDYPGGFEAV